MMYYVLEIIFGFAATVIIFVFIAVYNKQKRQEFHDIFSFSPKDDVTYDRQEVVDLVLTRYAVEFTKACNSERIVLSVKAESGHLSEEGEEHLLSLQKDVRVAKSRFWDAHGLAKRFRFRVKMNVRDYIPTIVQQEAS